MFASWFSSSLSAAGAGVGAAAAAVMVVVVVCVCCVRAMVSARGVCVWCVCVCVVCVWLVRACDVCVSRSLNLVSLDRSKEKMKCSRPCCCCAWLYSSVCTLGAWGCLFWLLQSNYYCFVYNLPSRHVGKLVACLTTPKFASAGRQELPLCSQPKCSTASVAGSEGAQSRT